MNLRLTNFILNLEKTVEGVQQNGTETCPRKCDYDALSVKLDYLESKLTQMDVAIREDRELIKQKLSHQTTLVESLLLALNQLNPTDGHNVTLKEGTSAVESHPPIHKYRSCKEVPNKQSGKYLLQPSEGVDQFMGYCAQTRFGDGGWLVVQDHTNGSLDFYRNWDEYRNGFGNTEHEFWIGLERLHQLTTARSYELVVELEDFSGNYLYAQYDEFAIGNETEHYPLQKVGKYSGTAGDSMISHRGMKFSTFDRDNDQRPGGNCAVISEGGWWYHNCHAANLNGRRLNSEAMEAMNWYHYKNSFVGMAYSRMLIREV
uniref:Fibrinogen C-terminal domain-containing protein n=1 Tax=Anopheles minimus TaxID=112268 RepID=A0A182WDC3_9DIPT